MDHIDESPLTSEKQANFDLLEITDSVILIGVTDKENCSESAFLLQSFNTYYHTEQCY